MTSDAKPLVTVVIPTWNRRGIVVEAIASVVAQTYQDWELVVVDDGSTDDTVRRLEELTIPKLQVIQSPHIGHLGRLRNLGARTGRGDLVAFLDSDDLWCATKLKRQVSALNNSNAGWSYTEYALLSENGQRLPLRSGRAPAISGHIVRELLSEKTAVCPCTLMVRRALFDAVGGFREDESIPFRGDSDIALRLARQSEAVAVEEILALVREHEGRMTRDIKAPDEHSAAVYEFFLRGETDPELRRLACRAWARCLANAGAARLAAGDYKSSADNFRKALNKSGVTPGLLGAIARGAIGTLKTAIRATQRHRGART